MITQIFDDKMTPTPLFWHNIDRKKFKMANLTKFGIGFYHKSQFLEYKTWTWKNCSEVRKSSVWRPGVKQSCNRSQNLNTKYWHQDVTYDIKRLEENNPCDFMFTTNFNIFYGWKHRGPTRYRIIAKFPNWHWSLFLHTKNLYMNSRANEHFMTFFLFYDNFMTRKEQNIK